MKKVILILLLTSCSPRFEVVDVVHDNGSFIHYFSNNKQGEEFKETTIVSDSLKWLIGTKMTFEQIRKASK